MPNLIVPWLMTQLVPKFPWDGAQAVLSEITCFTASVTSGSGRCNQRIIVMNWSNTDMDSGYHPVLLLNKHRPTHKLTIDRLYHQSIYLIMELYEERIGSQQKTCYFWHYKVSQIAFTILNDWTSFFLRSYVSPDFKLTSEMIQESLLPL